VARPPIIARLRANTRTAPQGVEHALAGSTTPLADEEEQRPRARFASVPKGYAVDDTVDLPSGYLPGQIAHHDQWHWPQPYRRYAELLAQLPELAAVAYAHRELWTRMLAAVPDGTTVLVVSHGGGIEPGLVTCLPHADHASWGPPFGHCDGACLCFDQGSFVDIEFHRVQDMSD
jgi:broad specificity phosphatase PhoE